MSQAPDLPAPLRHDPYAPLRIASFRWFVASILAMAMGAQIQGVVVAWQMYAVTHDPLALGMVGLAEAAPFITLALYAGHLADVLDRRRVALAALAVLFACSLALAVASHVFIGRGRSGQGIRWAIYGAIVIGGGARGCLPPARNALGADLVPRPLYPGALRAGSRKLRAPP